MRGWAGETVVNGLHSGRMPVSDRSYGAFSMLAEEIDRIVRDKELNDELKKLILEDHLKRQSEGRSEKRQTFRSILANGPFLAVIASVAAALVSGVFAYGTVLNQTASSQSLERLKFEFQLVQTALSEQKSPEERKKTLSFFQSVGLFQNLRIEDVAVADIPAISLTGENLFTIENLYPETAATIGLILSEAEISANSKTWKKFWHLYQVDLIGVESREVARAMVEFGQELRRLEEQGAAPSEDLRRLGRNVIQAMSSELPATQAFLEKITE